MSDNNLLEVKSTQYIVVSLGIEQFGIDIKYVDNIVRMQKITRVPKSQPFFKGVINLRGEVVPVMSMRNKFGLEDDEFTDKTRIIILKPEQRDAIGVIVDSVKEVVELENDSIEKVQSGKEDKMRYINAVGKNQGNLISLLNVSSVIEDVNIN